MDNEQFLEQLHNAYVESGEHELQAQIPITKVLLDRKAGEIMARLEAGQISALKVVAFAKYLEELSKRARAIAIEQALKELGGEPREVSGIKIEPSNGAVRYDYKHIPEWVELNEQLKAVEQAAKDALQAYEKNRALVDKDSAEVLPMARKSQSNDTVKVTIR